jgi:hypothetical protein
MLSKSQIAFGHAVGWGGDVQRRLEERMTLDEERGTTFTQWHLDQMVEKKLLAIDSPWYRRFQTAMVGEEWPQRTVTAEVQDGQVIVPLDLRGFKGATTIVLRVLAVLFFAFTIYKAATIWLLPPPPLEGERAAQFLVGGSFPRCLYYAGVFHMSDWESEEPFVAGEVIEIALTSYGNCFQSSQLYINDELYASSDRIHSVTGGHDVGYRWNTAGYEPGEYRIWLYIHPYPMTSDAAVTWQRIITLE